MKDITTHTGTLNIIRREKNSLNGNPRYTIQVGTTQAITLNDSSYSYTITNDEGKTVKALIGMHYNKVTLDSYQVIE